LFANPPLRTHFRKRPPKPEPKYRKYPIAFCRWCFTDLERRVLEQMLIAPVVKDASNALGLSISTVKFYRSRLLRKFGVDNILELLALLLRLNLQGLVHGINADHRKTRDRRYSTRTLLARSRYAKQHQRDYYEANREKILEKNRRWREAHREKRRRQDRRYYERHKDEIMARVKSWKARKRPTTRGSGQDE
jgi:DNA-binding CsgD family transcriptional regulator